jgi:hypothetical protein
MKTRGSNLCEKKIPRFKMEGSKENKKWKLKKGYFGSLASRSLIFNSMLWISCFNLVKSSGLRM